jgi:hypothetical protein
MKLDSKTANAFGAGITAVALKCKSDSAYRNAVMADGWKLLEDMDMSAGFKKTNTKVEVYQNTDSDYFFILPPNPNSALSDETLVDMNAAKGAAGCASTAACAGTASSFLSCLSSASTAGTAGSSS